MIWCLHGAVGMAADWNGCSKLLAAAGHAVRRVDLWRYLDCVPMSLEEFGRAFCEEVERSGESDHVLVGYSMGGRLGLHALLEAEGRKADLFRAAVIVSAHPGLRDPEERVLRLARDAEWAGRALAGDWNSFLDDWGRQAVLGHPARDAAQLTPDGLADRRLLQPRRQAVARSFMDWSLGQQGDLRNRLGSISCPLLWLTGAEDAKFSALAEELTPFLPTGRFEVVPGAGHRLPWEQEEEFVRRVDEFLRVEPHASQD